VTHVELQNFAADFKLQFRLPKYDVIVAVLGQSRTLVIGDQSVGLPVVDWSHETRSFVDLVFGAQWVGGVHYHHVRPAPVVNSREGHDDDEVGHVVHKHVRIEGAQQRETVNQFRFLYFFAVQFLHCVDDELSVVFVFDDIADKQSVGVESVFQFFFFVLLKFSYNLI